MDDLTIYTTRAVRAEDIAKRYPSFNVLFATYDLPLGIDDVRAALHNYETADKKWDETSNDVVDDIKSIIELMYRESIDEIF